MAQQTMEQLTQANKKLSADNTKLRNKVKELEYELNILKSFIGGML